MSDKLTKLGARRLLRLAKILDTADAVHKKRGEPTYFQGAYEYHDMENGCKTPLCAWGHYAAATPRLDGWSSKGGGALLKTNIAYEFSLNKAEEHKIFGFSGCGGANTAKQAANYIRSFVARKGIA